MNVKNLMVGDWYTWEAEEKKYPFQVTKETFKLLDEDIANFQPIPLTPEILEKNFQKDPDYINTYWRPDCRKFCFVKESDDWYFAFRYKGGHICIAECNYVHELQHILKSCGIEKEIVL